jgi:hypothetical protein
VRNLGKTVLLILARARFPDRLIRPGNAHLSPSSVRAPIDGFRVLHPQGPVAERYRVGVDLRLGRMPVDQVVAGVVIVGEIVRLTMCGPPARSVSQLGALTVSRSRPDSRIALKLAADAAVDGEARLSV